MKAKSPRGSASLSCCSTASSDAWLTRRVDYRICSCTHYHYDTYGFDLHEKTDLVHCTGTNGQSTYPRLPDLLGADRAAGRARRVHSLRLGGTEHGVQCAAAQCHPRFHCAVDRMPRVQLGRIALRRYRNPIDRRAGRSLMSATIRSATPADTGAIFALAYELAEFESLTHIFAATEDGLRDALFGARPSIEALVAENEGRIVGYALFFHNYSSF